MNWFTLAGVGLVLSAPFGGLPGWSAIAQANDAIAPSMQGFQRPVWIAQVDTDQRINTVLSVDPLHGNDAAAGNESAPYKTLTHALQVAQPNTVILLAPGTYSAATGETFPIALKSGVTVQGNPQTRGQDITLQGSGTYASPTRDRQTVTLIGANQAVLAGITIANPDAQGYAVWVEAASPSLSSNTFSGGRGGIVVAGNSTPLIRNSYFYQNGAAGIKVYDLARPRIEENIFEKCGVAIAVNQQAAPVITSNRITQNKDGIIVRDTARPKLRNNSVESNEHNGLLTSNGASPDLGAPGEEGGNFFRDNGQQDIGTLPPSSSAQPSSAQSSPQKINTAQISPPAPDTAIASTPTTPVRLSLIQPTLIQPIGPVLEKPAVNKPIAEKPPIEKSPAEYSTIRTVQPVAIAPTVTISPAIQPDKSAGLSATAFPVPGTLSPSSTLPAPTTPRPIQIIPILSSSRPIQRTESPVTPTIARDIAPPPAAPPAGFSEVLPEVAVQASRASYKPMVSAIARRPAVLQPSVAPPIPRQPSVLLNAAPINAAPTTAPIEIVVPPPESSAVPVSVVTSARTLPLISPPSNRATPAPSATLSLLPVPSPNIPVGNIGTMPSVYGNGQRVSQTSNGQAGYPSYQGSTPVRYRVIINASDTEQQTQIRSIVPTAFPIVYRGRSVMQAGAFSDRDKASQLVEALTSQGLQASVEPLQ